MIRLSLIVGAVALLALQPLNANAQKLQPLDGNAQKKSKSKRAPCTSRIENQPPFGSSDATCPVTKLPAPGSPPGLVRDRGLEATPGSQFGGNTTGGILVPKDKMDPFPKGVMGPKNAPYK